MKVLHGIAASPGITSGKAHVLLPPKEVDMTAKHTGKSADEIHRFELAVQQALAHLSAILATAKGATADILMAQQEMLDDPELKDQTITLISEGLVSESAVTRVVNDYAQQLSALPDPYLAGRAEDVREAGRRIVAALQGTTLEISLLEESILVAQDLSPAQTVSLNRSLLQGIVSASGSATGHLAIVAQGLDIPAVVGVSDALAHISEGIALIVDGQQGIVIIEPDEAQRQEATRRQVALMGQKRLLQVYRDRQGQTIDGTRIEVFANIGSLAEAQKAVEMGAEGVGLFRTELLASAGLPSEEEQLAVYIQIAEVLRRPLIIRTFDIGGDKPIPDLEIPHEANPFLGWRGIRLALDRPKEVLFPQIRAILRAGRDSDLRIMLPMVTTPEEVKLARALIGQALTDLRREGYNVRDLPVGIMVETPAAALCADQFQGLADFFSIGTNDLTQYTYAVDRTNPSVRERAKPLGIALLRLIAHVCQTGIPTAVCGQLAGDEQAAPLLVGLGVRELSVAPTRILTIKQLLATQSLTEMQKLAQRALNEET